MERTDFEYTMTSEPHRIRRKEMLQKYPEIGHLSGKKPSTFGYIVILVLAQLGLAGLLSSQSWWLIAAVAFFIGAFIDHALSVLIHECAHGLVFKSKVANKWAEIVANIPQIIPFAAQFDKYHIQHHVFQGIYELDLDLPSRWEAKLFGNHFIGKILWLLLYPFFQSARLSRVKAGSKGFNGWVLMNWLLQITTVATICLLFGIKAITFLIISFFFSLGVHPLGGRWIQEHYLIRSEQETYSYYGLLNKLTFNVGYHYEHHDFPSVPWSNLPKIRETAPDFYNTLIYHRSWVKLLMRFFFDKKLSIFSRLVRNSGL